MATLASLLMTMQPVDANLLPGFAISSAWMPKPERPNIWLAGLGVSHITYGPCVTVFTGGIDGVDSLRQRACVVNRLHRGIVHAVAVSGVACAEQVSRGIEHLAARL